MKTSIKLKNLLRAWFKKIETVHGARRQGWAFLCGALAAVAFPPFNLLPLLWFCFPAFVLLVRSTPNTRTAFLTGWVFALGLLIVDLYWIAGSLFVDIKEFWWAVPLAIVGLPALFALYYATAAAIARRFFDLYKVRGLVSFALLWFCADMTRGHALTGFPWDILGYVWGDIPQILQITCFIGISGLTLLTAITVVLPVLLLSEKTAPKGRELVTASLALLVGIGFWGEARLLNGTKETVPETRVRLVQTAISQSHKWRAEEREEHFQNIVDLSFEPSEQRITHIVWPETATPFYLGEDIQHRLALAAQLPLGTKLITGSVQRQRVNENKIEYYNSLIAIDDTAHIVAGYDKVHLVPFGEYMPFRKILPWRVITALGVDFTPGDGQHTLRLTNLPAFSPLVCYEAIFSGEVTDRNDPPQLLINVTNDAWYEHTTGPAQHFAIVRVRAIEEGVPLIRVANRGLSAVVDGYGRIRAKLAADHAGYVDSDVPVANSGRTLFSLYGDAPCWVMFFVCAFFANLDVKKLNIKLFNTLKFRRKKKE